MADFSALLSDSRVSYLSKVFEPHAELFLVGGCIRDHLLGKATKDIDLTCQLDTESTLKILQAAGIRSLETGARHGTVTAVIEHSNIEITSFRGKSAAEVGVKEALLSDLCLRDFSINAIAVSAKSGELFDPLAGANDLQTKVLRAPSAQIFADDPLRIIRMIRFGPAQGFSVDKDTYEAAKARLPDLTKVSIERIQNEFSGILVSPYPREALSMMLEIGLIARYFPEALDSVGFEQNEFHIESVFDHTLSVVANTPSDLTLRLAAFFHDLGKPHTLSTDEQGRRHFYEHEIKSSEITKKIMERLRYSNDLTKSVDNIVRYHMRPVDCGPSGVRRLMRDLGTDFEKWRKFKEADRTPVFTLEQTMVGLTAFDLKVQEELERAALEKQKKLVVTGYELMELGFTAGPQLGKAIKQLEEEVIDDPSRNSKEYLIARAKELLNS